MLYPCSCFNEYQDKKYGKGNRVHNPCQPKKAPQEWIRCIVCGKEKQL